MEVVKINEETDSVTLKATFMEMRACLAVSGGLRASVVKGFENNSPLLRPTHLVTFRPKEI